MKVSIEISFNSDYVKLMEMDIVSPPYVEGFGHRNHKIYENKFKTI